MGKKTPKKKPASQAKPPAAVADKKLEVENSAEETLQLPVEVVETPAEDTPADQAVEVAVDDPSPPGSDELAEPDELAQLPAEQTTEPEPETAPAPLPKKSQRKTTSPLKVKSSRRWLKLTGLVAAGLALLIVISGVVANRYYSAKVLPNVKVAGQASSGKTAEQLTKQLEAQQQAFSVTLTAGEKNLQPSLEQLGIQVDIPETVKQALRAKRDDSIMTRLAFWKQRDVPVVLTVDPTVLTQYVEANLPELSKPAQDAQLQFNPAQNSFSITAQADGQGADIAQLQQQLQQAVQTLSPLNLPVAVVAKGPTVTEQKLEPLLAPANELVARKIILTGGGYSYSPAPKEIASWITPTPQPDGSLSLVVDPAKIQSYVQIVAKNILSAPVDRKVIKDEASSSELVLQEGRDGTELADQAGLANAIAQAMAAGQDTTQTMTIKTAAHKTVNMNGYDKWIEIDLSAQTATAYEKATPVKRFVVATGMRGYETPTGEFAIWLKVRKQTMQGGSKADGSYYNIPNVEWVSYFYKDYALHGAWWRERFGAPASHGCVNMTNADAHWVYDWAPMGTKVVVHY